MAHSHQNTLLSRLGFSDPDRSDPKHTLACEYLCKPDVARKVLAAVGYKDDPCDQPKPVVATWGSLSPVGSRFERLWVQTETPVMNGKFYIGFTDVAIHFSETIWTPYDSEHASGDKWNYKYTLKHNTRTILVEVKVKRCDPADAIKQVKLYREYQSVWGAVVATCYPVSQSTKDMLKREGIHHIFLGAGFEAYCAERRAEKPVSEEGL